MDYEKKYKEALERAKKELDVCGSQDCDATRQIFRLFPELRESEDERIRKEKIFLQEVHSSVENSPKYRFVMDAIAWLEKKGTSYTKRDVDDAYVEGMAFAKGELEKQGGQKPAWTAQDEERLQSCLNILQAKGIMGVTETINTKWLKSLKQRLGG